MNFLNKAVIVSVLSFLVLGQNTALGDEKFSTEMIIENDVAVMTRAGNKVYVNVFRPEKPGKYPVLLSMGAYGKDKPHSYNGTFGDGQIFVSENAAFETVDPDFWVRNEYVVIAADSPGALQSEGDLDVFGPIEANAYYDVIEWAGDQEWSNGNVGLNGCSYFAVSQWFVAALNPPSLKAIMPDEGLTDFYRDVIRHGGVPHVFAKPWTERRILNSKNPDAKLIKNMAEMAETNLFFDDIWADANPDLKSITAPAYVITSWPDHGLHTRGTLIGFEEISSDQKWLDVHGRKKWELWYSRESLERQKKFYDHFLKGADNGFEKTPRVRYERRNAFYDGHDQFADDWPLADAKNTELYLTADGTLASKAGEVGAHSYSSTTEDDLLEFRIKFDKPTEITGGSRLKLWIETDAGEDIDLFVGLAKLDADGREIYMSGYNDVEHGHVASGWLRVSHRELDEDKSTDIRPWLKHERKLPVPQGEKIPVDVEILPHSTFFDKGESLVLRINGSELYAAGDIAHHSPVNSGTHTVHVGGETLSYLLLPVVRK